MMLTRVIAVIALLRETQALPDAFEWAGVFPISAAEHKWSMQAVAASACAAPEYVDPAMKVVFVPTSDVSAEGLEAVESAAEALDAGTCADIKDGETMTIASGGSCFNLVVGSTEAGSGGGAAVDSEFTITTSGISGLVVFAQHVPIEFERDRHYLYTAAGEDVEPAAEEGGGGHDGHDHGRRLSKRSIRRLSDDPHAGHDHGGGSDMYEWKGVFAVADSSHVWSMQKVDGDYADPAMKLVLFATEADASEADPVAATAETLMEGDCTEVDAGGSMTPTAAGACYDLHVDCDSDDSFYTIVTSGMTGMTVFAQHVPIEFERDQHYLKDSSGEDIEPLSFEKRWGPAILASFIVNLITLCGVIFAVPFVYKLYQANENTFMALANAASAGALIACAVFLMFPEGYLYVAVGSPSEGNTAFMFGVMLLAGVITASVIDLVVHVLKGAMCPAAARTDTAKDVEGVATTDAAPAPTGFFAQQRVLSAVIIGDFAHNFFDGTFIGIAFSGCSNSLAWAITVATVLHEIPQELADYIILTDPKQGKLKPVVALILNFLSGLSIVLGVILIMSMDFGPRTVGAGLVFGGGIYVQIGLGEAMGRVYMTAQSAQLKLGCILLFCLGALAIGLVLFDHEHCVPEGDTSHEGHDH